jgi:uncharacterized repeat protein (TIGR01451 family)
LTKKHRVTIACGLTLILSFTGTIRADYMNYLIANPSPPFNTWKNAFPNWKMLPTSSFIISECDDVTCAWCTTSSIVGVTMFNYGTAGSGEIAGMYFSLLCGAFNPGTFTLAYAGLWTVGIDTYPAWTWAGSITLTTDPTTGCLGSLGLNVYTDIAPCPADATTIELGPGYNPVDFGGITDNCWSKVPWGVVTDDNPKQIVYVGKQTDREIATPGDTINYTIYIGKPGTSYTSLVVIDTQPLYTHYVSGSAVPAPDFGYDPDPGPPARLRWTLGGATSAGGQTQEIRFALSIDWGNGESFDGSGDIAAPENGWLRNNAQAFWTGLAGCSTGTAVTPTCSTVVKRFLFWKLGSNDILFAGRVGQPDDEMIYEIFVKNMSDTKTWWNVAVWDTVPAEMDAWSPGFGLEDPCVGWTMTPTGCAPANPGHVFSGSKTILTWKMDLPPSATTSLRWKCLIKPTTPAKATVINKVSIQAMGKTGIVGGTGNSGVPANFTHLAAVILRTTYYSYTSYGASASARECSGFFISFFPLNINTNFELRKLEVMGAGTVADTGGKSQTINTLVGSCVGGFADGGLSTAGCKIERAPAMYWPGIWDAVPGVSVCPTFPFDFLYKVTSNSPFLWILMSEIPAVQEDAHTYDPSTSMTYRGFVHFLTRRIDEEVLSTPGHGDRIVIINTGFNSNNVFDPTLGTTVHIFQWNPTQMTWDYQLTGNIDAESLWIPFEGTYGTTVNDIYHTKVISSDAQNLIYHSDHTLNTPAIGGAYDNYGTIVPNSGNGNLIASTIPANYYVICNHGPRAPNCVVGNVSMINRATYRIWKYTPYNATVPGPTWPTTMAGSSGYWTLKATHTVEAGLAVPGNPHVYGAGFDTAMTSTVANATPWKVELTAGGPIQVYAGGCIYDVWSGASNIHAADGNGSGDEFWFHAAEGGGGFGTSCAWDTYAINVFCPKSGMAVGMNSTGNWTATYTTDGVDQCIVWKGITNMGGSNTHNYRITLRAAGVQGIMVAQYQQCTYDEKFLTAPFVETGVHYEIIAPPTVYSGQSFCLTVVVVDSGGGTKTDYAGTTSFTSSDPKALMEGAGMDGFNFTWVAATDKGVHLFCSVILSKIGPVTIVAGDTADGSILGVTTVTVVGVDVKFFKEDRFAIAASGDTVRFKLCWSNYSSASAFTFVVTDAVPVGTTYVPEVPSAMNCGSTDGVTVTVAYSLDTTTPPTTWTTASGMLPASTPRWLRWTMPVVGVQTTGCACFKVSVN